ncbi:MAG: peptide deformylase [Flammeovirgaceae bacterium]
MIYPIVAYGDPILKKIASDIEKDGSLDVKKLSEDMFETMYAAGGVGLAAPQIGLSVRMFVIDTGEFDKENKNKENQEPPLKQVFINAKILNQDGNEWSFSEGCLSIPTIRENIQRKERIKIRFYDENWVEYEKEFDGLTARVIQHEYDHIQGILFIDYLSPLKKRLIKNKLINISRGNVKHEYRMKFPEKV